MNNLLARKTDKYLEYVIADIYLPWKWSRAENTIRYWHNLAIQPLLLQSLLAKKRL